MSNTFYINFEDPPEELAEFVERIGIFHNRHDEPKEVIVLPDGRVDLFFMQTSADPFEVFLMGLETEAEQRIIPPHTLTYAISFKPLAVEYILRTSISAILNSARNLQSNFWDFDPNVQKDFDSFRKWAIERIERIVPRDADGRKRKLFELIYSSNGEMSVKELSDKVFWSSRQINRYFNDQFGLSLKTYCNILRFRGSLDHIAKGKLFPELNFADQNHFIKAIKKYSGVVPKELFKNENGRFVLLSVLKQQ